MLSHLFKPLRLRNVVVRNRFVKSATSELRASEDGAVTQSLVEHYDEIAAGGVGLIVVAASSVHQSGRSGPKQISLERDDLIEPLKRLTDAIHARGAKVSIQLFHGGRYANPRVGGVPSAPSKVRGVANSPLTEAQIWEIVRAFGAATRRAKQAGFDAVEVASGHGYLVHQFLSPKTNLRLDSWGNGVEGRFRFLREIYREAREQSGDFPICAKLNANDYVSGGLDSAACRDIAIEAARVGFDGVTLTGGIQEEFFRIIRGGLPLDIVWKWNEKSLAFRTLAVVTLRLLKKKASFEQEYFLGDAAEIARAVAKESGGRVVTGIVGGMRDPKKMEACIRDRVCDLVFLARPLIAEPGFPKRVLAEDLRLADCDNCNRCLFATVMLQQPLNCHSKWPAGARRENAHLFETTHSPRAREANT